MTKRSTPLGLALAALLVIGAAMPAAAITVTVRCGVTPPAPGEYESISAALVAAKSASSRDHVIHVYGACAEYVRIMALDYVQIIGHGGATLSYPASPASEPALNLGDTRGTQIQDLMIIGNGENMDLVRIFYSTAIKFNTVTIKGSGGSGVFVNQGSTVQFRGCVIEGNKGTGVRVSTGSVGTFGENANVSTTTVIQENGGPGISGDRNAHVFLGGNVSVVNNGGPGVLATASNISTCCETGLRTISGNGGSGIAVTGGSFRNNGPLEIEGNRGAGVELTASNGRLDPNGTTLTIRDNDGYGVLANRNSSVDIYDSRIEHNKAMGVLALDSSTALIIRSEIQSNGGAGVAAYILSVALISSGNAITGNAGFDLFCTPDSAGRGTKVGVGKIFCSGFNQYPSPNPDPPK